MKIKKINKFYIIQLLVVFVVFIMSCDTDLYETYDEYLEGNIISVAKPDSITAIQGNNKNVTFLIHVNTDPKIKKGVVTWDFGQSEATFDIDRTAFISETYEIEIQTEEEGLAQEFIIHLEDAFGDESIKSFILVNILGEEYRSSLRNRTYSSIGLNNDNETVIAWNVNANELLVSTELTYTNTSDVETTIVVDSSENETIISDFQSEGMFTLKTTYKASELSSDVFISDATQGTFPSI